MDLFSWFTGDDPVPAVDPVDLRSIWAMHAIFRPGPQLKSQRTYASLSVLAALVRMLQAVWYRLSMLWILGGPMAMLSPWWSRNGELADAVFQVAATFPMKRMSVGVRQQELPFDVQGSLAEIEREENNQ